MKSDCCVSVFYVCNDDDEEEAQRERERERERDEVFAGEKALYV
jgi:hypothetical protein